MYDNTSWNLIADYLFEKTVAKDLFSKILSFLWKGHNKRLQSQIIDEAVTIPNQAKSVIWNWTLYLHWVE